MTVARPSSDVTAVISTHNRRHELNVTLTGLLRLGYPDLRIIVVDNASDDGTAAFVRENFAGVTLWPHSDNRPLRGYNLGFNAVRTPYVLVLDDDSCPRPGAIERMVQRLQDVPCAGAVAANIIGSDGQSEWGGEGGVAFSSDWCNLIGCGFLVRRNVLAQARGYNEAFGLYYNDTELALRILALGYRIVYDPAAVVEHRRGGTAVSALKYRLMLRNFPLLLGSHFAGWQRIDLILGHAVIALWQAGRHRCLAPALKGMLQTGGVSSQRSFLPAPGTNPAIRRFIQRYSLTHRLRLRREPVAPPDGHATLTEPVWPLMSLRRVALSRPLARPCRRGTRFRNDPVSVPRDTHARPCLRRAGTVHGCDCADWFGWYASPWEDYRRYLARFSYLDCNERRSRARQARAWPYRPVISILTPVYKTRTEHLKECLLSVERQIYPNWELCAVDDGSGIPAIRRILEDFAARHPGRVKLVFRQENRGIARTSQEALELAGGEFIVLLDHDDRLAPEALWEAVARLNLKPDLDWLYGDYDKISPDGQRYFYHFKPAWSPELLLGYCYVLHPSVIRRELVRRVGGFRPGFEGAQDFDLYLRIAEQTDRVEHLPRILYSWRQSPDSTAQNPASKPYSYESAGHAIDAALRRRGEVGKCETVTDPGVWAGVYRIRRPDFQPNVDLVILSRRDRARTLDPDAGLADQVGLLIVRRFTPLAGESDGAVLARALHESVAPFLLLVDEGVTVAAADTLHGFVAHLAIPGVGAVAPKVVSARNKVDHCGLALAPGGRLIFPLRGLDGGLPGYGAYGTVARNVAAVSPVAVAFRVSALRQAGGFDAGMTATGAVIGACCALIKTGFRVVADGGAQVCLEAGPFAPGAPMEPGGRDHLMLTRRYASLFVGGDPFYNRNLRFDPPDFGVWHATDNA